MFIELGNPCVIGESSWLPPLGNDNFSLSEPMGRNTKIEWCDHTFNPWIGCQKISPGCNNCYAEALMDKRFGSVTWGPHGERKRTSDANWKEPLRWARLARETERRSRVFCASLADWLDNKVPQSWRVDLAKLIEATPELDWMLLTKRIENFRKLNPWRGGIPENVCLGTTCEDQAHFERRYPILTSIAAKVRWICYEPAVGPLSIRDAYPVPDWIICGGENGSNPRYMEPIWARNLRDECDKANVPFFMKQMTARAPIPNDLLVRQLPRDH
jgi:protein gp37